MAIRYSGDVVVRMKRLPDGRVQAVVTDGRLSFTVVSKARARTQPSSEDYDRIAEQALERALRVHGRSLPVARSGRVLHVQRRFVAPCRA